LGISFTMSDFIAISHKPGLSVAAAPAVNGKTNDNSKTAIDIRERINPPLE
jgi:hypothetical protein